MELNNYHFTGIALNRCLTTEYSETTAHFNGNFWILTNKSTYRSLSTQRLSELTVQIYLLVKFRKLRCTTYLHEVYELCFN
jgi:hypothetical protein